MLLHIIMCGFLATVGGAVAHTPVPQKCKIVHFKTFVNSEYSDEGRKSNLMLPVFFLAVKDRGFSPASIHTSCPSCGHLI